MRHVYTWKIWCTLINLTNTAYLEMKLGETIIRLRYNDMKK